jgi:ankyrin repeat protein
VIRGKSIKKRKRVKKRKRNKNLLGVSVATPNKEESMPLHIASFSGHADIVELLIKEGNVFIPSINRLPHFPLPLKAHFFHLHLSIYGIVSFLTLSNLHVIESTFLLSPSFFPYMELFPF